MMGALTGATKSSVLAGTPMVLLGMLVLWLLRWRLNVTTLPTDEAQASAYPCAGSAQASSSPPP